MALGHHPRHGGDGGGHVGKGHQQHRPGGGQGHQAQGDLGENAQRALGTDQEVDQVVASHVLDPLAAQVHDLAAGQHHLQAQHVAPGDAVLDGPAAAGVLGYVAADEAGLEAHGIASIKEAELAHRLVDLVGHDAGLDGDRHVLLVNLQDAVHALQGKQDAAEQRHRAAGQAGPGAAGRHRHPLPIGQAQDGGHLLRPIGLDHDLGQVGVLVAGHLVAGVGLHAVGLAGNHMRFAHDAAQFVDQIWRDRPVGMLHGKLL